MLRIVASCHCMQFKEKLMNQTWENDKKKLVLGPILSPLTQTWALKISLWILSLLDVIHCCKLSLYAILRKTNQPNSIKWQKPSFWPRLPNFLWFRQPWDVMVSYHHVQCQEKLIIQSWENLVTDGQTDRRTREISYDAVWLTLSVQ